MKIFTTLLVLMLTACSSDEGRVEMKETMVKNCAVELKVTLTLTQYGSDTVVYYCDKWKKE